MALGSNRSFDIGEAATYAVGVRLLCVAALFWIAVCGASARAQPAVGTCLGGNCQVGAPAAPPSDHSVEASPPRGFARGAAWFGLVSGVLSLGGSIAIASMNDHEHESITRGVWVGYTALAAPVVALGSFTTRKRARVEGSKPLRVTGWMAYTGALSNGIVQWYLVLQDARPSAGFTVGVGLISLLSFLPHAFDAYLVSRAARARGFARVAPTSSGFVVRF